MRRILSILVLFIFISCTLGCYYFYQAALRLNYASVQNRIQSRILREELMVIKIDVGESSSIHWKPNHKEFSFNGRMYDVVRLSRSRDHLFICCYPDRKENRLLTGLKAQRRNDLPASRIISKIQQTQYLMPSREGILSPGSYSLAYYPICDPLHSADFAIHSPPPKPVAC